MKRFSASYAYFLSNFVIIGCERFGHIDSELTPFACVIENILQRGMPTRPSRRLIEFVGNPVSLKMARPVRKLITHEHVWSRTIKGSPDGKFNPALHFLKTLLPSVLPPGNRFLLNYILPEAFISDIVEDCDPRFTGQQVDFFCPRANLVIEIDGLQHGEAGQPFLDRERDLYLKLNGVDTLRIKTDELDAHAVAQELCERFDASDQIPEDVDEGVLLAYEIAMRVQIAVVELLKQSALSLHDPIWTIDFTCDLPDIDAEGLAAVAIEDVLDIFENLCALANREFKRPCIKFGSKHSDIALDVSATKMWSEAESDSDVVYVRNDYYECDDHFSVANSSPIAYETASPERRDDVDKALEFFLKYLFGYDEFRPGQAGIMRKSLARNATLGILPTGSGKSLCYQVACILQPCVSFVVCPIISLMQDQEVNARKFGIDRVGRIESQMDSSEKNEVLDKFGKGKCLFIWIAPERFQMVSFREQLSAIATRRHFGYAVIDEVHCLSEWGHDFRISYLKLYRTIRKFCPQAEILALTATASRNVLEDLLSELEITKANVQTSTNLDRPELKYHIVRTTEEGREGQLDRILDEINCHFQQTEGVESIFEPLGEASICGIVFSNIKNSSARKIASCEGVLAHLRSRDIEADSYHADRGDDRTRIQSEYLDNKFTVMCATKAFGMGVNKKNVRYTIHNGLPWSIEAFYQEAGRAGRDPKRNESQCYILYSDDSNPEAVKSLFAEATSISEIREIQQMLTGDLGTLFFLWGNNHEDIEIERNAIVETFKELNRRRRNDGHVLIPFDLVKKTVSELVQERARIQAKREGRAVKAEAHIGTQDVLYKLAILGIVQDWTVDYRTKCYDVEVVKIDSSSEEHVRSSLEAYIKRHNPTFSFDTNSPTHRNYVETYRQAPQGKKLIGLIDVLLKWTNDNIVFSRRRSIGNMLELCESKRGDSEIREYINNYFRLDTEANDQLDAIVRDTSNISTWIRLFMTYELTDDPAVQKEVIKGPSDIAAISALCDRYRESYHANIGLEWANMVAKLLANSFSEADIVSQFGFVASEIKEYEGIDAEELFEQTLKLLDEADDEAKDAFGLAVVRHATNRIEQTYRRLNDTVTLRHLVTTASSKLSSIWGRKRK